MAKIIASYKNKFNIAVVKKYNYFEIDDTKKTMNRPFSYSTKEPGSSDIFIQFHTQGSIEWR